jgi:hypothetical protein
MTDKNNEISRRQTTDAASMRYTIVITPSASSQVPNLQTYSAKHNTNHHVRSLSNNNILILKSNGIEPQEESHDSNLRTCSTKTKDRSVVDVRSQMRRTTTESGRMATSEEKLLFSDQGI